MMSERLRRRLGVCDENLFGGSIDDTEREVARDALQLIIAEALIELVAWQEAGNA